MAALRREIQASEQVAWHLRQGQVRRFTQKFCYAVRTSSAFSLEDLCDLLNEHPDIQLMKLLLGANFFLPLTPQFLNDLESDIIRIIEFNPFCGGFLGIGHLGIPTIDVAQAIARVCTAERDFKRFYKWRRDYLSYGDI